MFENALAGAATLMTMLSRPVVGREYAAAPAPVKLPAMVMETESPATASEGMRIEKDSPPRKSPAVHVSAAPASRAESTTMPELHAGGLPLTTDKEGV
jgi:hypothetical protein